MRYTLSLLALVLTAVVLAGCGKKSVSFKEQIQPILNARCVQCHGNDVARGKIVMASYAAFMTSHTISGKEPLVIPGNPYQSRLYILCSTNQPHFRMPPDTSTVVQLSPDELELLRHWITEGAKDN
ncbi:MAG TPA: c-type cytochrome domain-containing protein [Bacteroidota bacterium]|nr:c-type cytochrome domain-containing protein [Bacteroidota bacterium]